MQPCPTALIVDPEPAVRLLARVILEPVVHCLEAASAEDAWAMVVSTKPDLVLLETRLSDADGSEFCRQLTSLPHQWRPLVVVVTTTRGAEALSSFRAAGASAYVAKPFRVGTLYRVLQQLPLGRPFGLLSANLTDQVDWPSSRIRPVDQIARGAS